MPHQELASWIFGGISFASVIGIFCFAPSVLPPFKHRLLGLLAALAAAFLAFFTSGSLGLGGNSTLDDYGKFGLKATEGLALLVLVLYWWNPDKSPTKRVKK